MTDTRVNREPQPAKRGLLVTAPDVDYTAQWFRVGRGWVQRDWFVSSGDLADLGDELKRIHTLKALAWDQTPKDTLAIAIAADIHRLTFDRYDESGTVDKETAGRALKALTEYLRGVAAGDIAGPKRARGYAAALVVARGTGKGTYLPLWMRPMPPRPVSAGG
ncbi:hypothetical protein [Agromyces humi]|uniref:hypothetical protein n=1 Tax=Agromyces humi TaxID=1766800 RepID=UPI00135C111F|nr:hypothetical protein [Agromyces humi]